MTSRLRASPDRAIIVLALVAASAPVVSTAEGGCISDETLAACWERFERAALPPTKAATPSRGQEAAKAAGGLLADQHQRLLAMPVGLAVGGARTATQNVLPGFNLAALPAGEGEAAAVIQGAWNFAFGGTSANNSQLGLAANPKPTLAEPVKNALQDAGLSPDDFEASLDALDDLTATYSWYYRGRLLGVDFGRDLALYRNELSSLLAALLAELPDQSTWVDRFTGNCIGEVPAGDDVMSYTVRDVQTRPVFRQNKSACDDVLKDLPAAAIANARLIEALAASGRDVGLDRFADLVSNQPQFYVTLRRVERDPLVGASLTGVETGFEMGWVNLNNFLADYGKTCRTGGLLGWGRSPDDARARDSCLAAYGRYVHEKNGEGGLEAQGRIAVRIGYARLDDLDMQLPAPAGNVHVDGVNRLHGEVTVGRAFWQEPDGRSTRVDGSARYEHYGNDAARVDRTSYSLVLTQRVGTLSFPLVLAYSDKTEFGGESGDLAATVGLGFDFAMPVAPGVPRVPLEPSLEIISP